MVVRQINIIKNPIYFQINFINNNKSDGIESKELQLNKRILEIKSLITEGKNILTKHMN